MPQQDMRHPIGQLSIRSLESRVVNLEIAGDPSRHVDVSHEFLKTELAHVMIAE